MMELKIAGIRTVLEEKQDNLKAMLDMFEKNPTLQNRKFINNAIMDYRTQLTDLKRYINGLYIRS